MLSASIVMAQEDRGAQTAASGAATPAGEFISGGEDAKPWFLGASANWNSLYMFRGVNILGNGNGVCWFGADLGVIPWENGVFTFSAYYGLGSYYNPGLHQERYAEFDAFADYTHQFGPLVLSAGYCYYYYPNMADARGNAWSWQNEVYVKAAWEFLLRKASVIPAVIYYCDLGPQWGAPHGIANGGASYLVLRVDSSIPVYKEIVALEPGTAFGVNFGANSQWTDGNAAQRRFAGGNNWELGVSIPVSITSWFTISPYVAYSYQWQNLPSYNRDSAFTAANTWWTGVTARFSF